MQSCRSAGPADLLSLWMCMSHFQCQCACFTHDGDFLAYGIGGLRTDPPDSESCTIKVWVLDSNRVREISILQAESAPRFVGLSNRGSVVRLILSLLFPSPLSCSFLLSPNEDLLFPTAENCARLHRIKCLRASPSTTWLKAVGCTSWCSTTNLGPLHFWIFRLWTMSFQATSLGELWSAWFRISLNIFRHITSIGSKTLFSFVPHFLYLLPPVLSDAGMDIGTSGGPPNSKCLSTIGSSQTSSQDGTGS